MNIRLYTTLASVWMTLAAVAQNDNGSEGIVVSGSVQSDILIPQTDKEINSEKGSDWARTNTYADVNLMSKHVDAGLRFEYNDHPLPGFENDFKGWGVPYFYAKLHYDKWNLTLGSLALASSFALTRSAASASTILCSVADWW